MRCLAGVEVEPAREQDRTTTKRLPSLQSEQTTEMERPRSHAVQRLLRLREEKVSGGESEGKQRRQSCGCADVMTAPVCEQQINYFSV